MVTRGGLLILLSGAALCPVAAFADTPADPAADPGEIVITARAERLYRVTETQVGKLPGEPLTIPASIQVVNSQLIRDQGARDAQDLYRNLSGISFFSYGGVTARGFRQEEVFYDGLRGDPSAGFSVPQLFNIERVEFLKGPAGMLYGPGAPGGLLNYVTRKPKDRFAAEIRAIGGDLERKGVSLEATGPLFNSPVSARAGLFFEDRDTPRTNATSTTEIYDGAVSLQSGFGRFTVQHTIYQQDLGGNRLRGVPTDNAGNFLADRRWNHNEPTDFLRLDASATQISIESDFSDRLSLNAAFRFGDTLETQQYHEPNGLFDSDRDGVVDSTRRQYRDQIRDQNYWTGGANLVWSLPGEHFSARLLGGVDTFKSELTFDGRSLNGTDRVGAGRPAPLSLRQPVYNVTPTITYVLPAFTRTLTEQFRIGGYALGEITFGRLIATGGVRFDRFEDTSSGVAFEDDKATFRAQSFEPQGVSSQDRRAGGPFAPTQGEMLEGGAKAVLANGRFQATIAGYQIVRENILQADPRGDPEGDGISNLVAFGEVTSKGFEIDIAADITPDWVLTANYGYNDTRITATNGRTAITNAVGDRFANAPKHKLGFWTRYQIADFAFAVGGEHVSERLSLSNQIVKPYTVFDGSIIYTRDKWKVMARIDNIFDKTYAASGFIDRTGHFPGEPRSFFIEISRSW
jgi:iron complex outermembrane recepter protein